MGKDETQSLEGKMGPDQRRGTFSVRTAEAVDAFVNGVG